MEINVWKAKQACCVSIMTAISNNPNSQSNKQCAFVAHNKDKSDCQKPL